MRQRSTFVSMQCLFLALPLLLAVVACGSSKTSDVAAGNNVVGGSGNTTNTASSGRFVSLPMSGCTIYDYYTSVTLGGETFSLLVDSGSTTTAVAASSCTSCDLAEGYNTAKGTSTNTKASSLYGDGSSWSGMLYTDAMAMGTSPNALAPSANVNFAAISQQQNFFYTNAPQCLQNQSAIAFDGILGLGPDALLEKGSTSYLTAIAGAAALGNDLFALHTCDVGGTIMLGGYDSNRMTQAPVYLPLTTSGTSANYYGLALTSLTLEGASTGLGSNVGTVVDNGTGGLYLPSAMYAALISALNKNAAYAANFSSDLFSSGSCEYAEQNLTRDQLDAALPKLTFTFKGTNNTTVAVALTASHSYLLPVSTSDGKTGYCPVVSGSDSIDFVLFGNTVMREHVVVFDRANARIGFAPQQGCSSDVAWYGN